ncbi:MAG: CHRD domain-containing protein [Acidimicrobiales bacterium]
MGRYLRAIGVGAVVLGVVTLVPGAGAAADDGGRPFELDLSGANEFNASGVPINPHGDDDRGTGSITINPGLGEVCFEFGALTLTAGDALPNNAHIHRAPAGVAGPVVVPLFGSQGAAAPTSYPTESTCVGDVDRALLIEIIQHPDEFYVNLHNAQHPAGVMRDQLHK